MTKVTFSAVLKIVHNVTINSANITQAREDILVGMHIVRSRYALKCTNVGPYDTDIDIHNVAVEV